MAKVPSHWGGRDTAPGFSRLVAMAAGGVAEAEKKLVETMQREYPLHAAVRVVHSRGSFYGNVAGWDKYGIRIAVTNANSGKTSKWWAAHVEVSND